MDKIYPTSRKRKAARNVISNCKFCSYYTYRKGKPYCPLGKFRINCEDFEEIEGIVEAIPVEGLDIKKFVDKLYDMQGTKD